MRRTFAAAIVALALFTISPTAYAQSSATDPSTGGAAAGAEPQASGEQDEQQGLSEIVVTATRRNENLQNVPVAVSAITANELQSKGVFETSDLSGSLPNLQVSSPYGKQQPNFSLRGVGVGTEFNANAASPVGVYVDEVYQAFRASHGQQLYDLNQIEVVRGPQGTLYGRNTTGGAINFITRAPELSGQNGYATIGYGSYNRVSGEGAIEVTPAQDRFGIRLAFTYVDADNYIHNRLPAGLNTSAAGGASGLNRYSGGQPGGTQSVGLRLTTRWKPVDDLDITLKVYGGESRGGVEVPLPTGQTKGRDVINYTNPNFLLGGLFSQLSPLGLVPASYSASSRGLDLKEVEADTVGHALTNSFGAVLNVKLRLSDTVRVISVTGYDDGRYEQQPTDCDATPLRLCALAYNSAFGAFNQDVRIDYSGDRLKLIVGGFYGRDRIRSQNTPDFFNLLSDVRTAVGLPSSYFNPAGSFNGTALSATSLPTGIRAAQSFRQVRTSYAAYGEGSFEITQSLKVTAGVRYTKDRTRFFDGITTYYDDAGTARLLTVSNFRQGGAYAPYFLQPVRNEAGVIVIPSYPSLGIPLPGGLERVGESSSVSGRVIVDWKPTEKSLVYASYSRGYRAGTFNGLAYGSANQVYFVAPEKVDAFEIGFKSRWLDNHLQINGAFFYYDYKGQQGQVVDASATANLVSLNGSMKGLEIDAILQVTNRLKLSGSIGVLDTSYAKGACPANPATIPSFPAQLGSCVVSSGGPVSVAGNPFPYAADVSGNIALDWDAAVFGDNKITVHADTAYTGQFYYDSFKDYSRGPLRNVTTGDFANGEGKYWLVNARLSYSTPRFTLAVWGKNLTGRVYYPFGIAIENLFGNGYRVRSEPRTYGAEVTIRW